MATTYELALPTQTKGDTFMPYDIQLTSDDAGLIPVSLVGATIKMGIREYPTDIMPNYVLEVGSGITIFNGANGQFRIDEQIIDWPTHVYHYYLTITLAGGQIYTIINGNWEIVNA